MKECDFFLGGGSKHTFDPSYISGCQDSQPPGATPPVVVDRIDVTVF